MVHEATHGAEADDDAEGQEKKANYFVPKGMDGLNDSGNDVFDKLFPMSHGQTLPHAFMVTKGAREASPAFERLVNCR